MAIVGARHAFRVIHPGPPQLRIRYRHGVAIDQHGFPDWLPYARAAVDLGPTNPELGTDSARVVDVLVANEVMGSDPLWSAAGSGRTPAGWTWTRPAGTRLAVAVPIELHASFRHVGGVSTGGVDRTRRGLADVAPGLTSIAIERTQRLDPDAVAALERHLGFTLPADYREFLAATNGGWPSVPAVDPRFGFVVDQPFFGVARDDWLQDLTATRESFRDRLTPDWLAIGFVQGGLLAVRVRTPDRGSIWYYDDDDPRDLDSYRAGDVCERLLHRCADDFISFWSALRPMPDALRAAARAAATQATRIDLDELVARRRDAS